MNIFVSRFFLASLCLSYLMCWHAYADHRINHETEKELIIKVQLAYNDTAKIYYLNKLAHHYSTIENNDVAADSANQIALEIAERSLDDLIILNAYNNYLETNNTVSFKKKAGEIVVKAEQIATRSFKPKLIWRTFQNISSYHFRNYEYDKALNYAHDAFTISGNIENESYRVQTYLLIGRCLEQQNKKIEALRNYFSALHVSDRLDEDELRVSSYNYLSEFYKFSKMYTKAEEYKRKEYNIIKSIEPIDSIRIISALVGFEGIALNSPSQEINENNIRYILGYLDRKPNQYIKSDATALYRTYLISNKKFDKLYEFYTDRYPEDLVELKNQNYSLYLKTKAFMCEVQDDVDSALHYFNSAAQLIEMNPNKSFVANFYIRFGEFYERQNNIDEAIMMYRKSLEASRQTTYIPFSYSAANGLKKLYAKKEDYANAYKFSIISTTLADSLLRIAKLDQLLAMEIDNEARMLTMLNERQESKTKRRHNIQYTAIVILIFSAFVALMVAGKYNVQPWVIRTIGFFAFIFAFEFIILIADNIIHHATHGEPWKILLIKIFLIGVLLPLHHFIEGVAIKYILDKEKKSPKKIISIREFVNKYVLKEGQH